MTTQAASHEIGKLCRNDRRLSVSHVRCAEKSAANAAQAAYLTKTSILEELPYPRSIFLDADTLVVGDITELLCAAHRYPLVVTNFMASTTTGRTFRLNVRGWRELQGQAGDRFKLRQRIDAVLADPYPAINTGVFAIRAKSRLIREWTDLCHFGRKALIPDEIGLQLLLLDFPHQLLGHEYNCHPNALRHVAQPRILHFVAGTHLELDSCRNIWLPAYRECRAANLAQMQQWSRVGRKPGASSTHKLRGDAK